MSARPSTLWNCANLEDLNRLPDAHLYLECQCSPRQSAAERRKTRQSAPPPTAPPSRVPWGQCETQERSNDGMTVTSWALDSLLGHQEIKGLEYRHQLVPLPPTSQGSPDLYHGHDVGKLLHGVRLDPLLWPPQVTQTGWPGTAGLFLKQAEELVGVLRVFAV